MVKMVSVERVERSGLPPKQKIVAGRFSVLAGSNIPPNLVATC